MKAAFDQDRFAKLEQVRNRLAFALLGAVIAAFTVLSILYTAAQDFRSTERSLKEAREEIEHIQIRNDILKGSKKRYFVDRAADILVSLCLPENYHDYYKTENGNNACEFGKFGLLSKPTASVIAEPIGQCLSELPLVKGSVKIESARRCFEYEPDLNFYLYKNYSEGKLNQIIKGLWIWEMQRNWIVGAAKSRFSPDLTSGSTTYTTFLIGSTSSENQNFQNIGARNWFKKNKYYEINQAINRLINANPNDIEAIINPTLEEIKILQDSNTLAAYVEPMQFGDVRFGLTYLLHLFFPAISLLSVACLIYVRKVESFGSPSASEWFPRLDESADPFSRLPIKDKWPSRFMWLLFLVLPIAFSFLYVFADSDLRLLSISDVGFWRYQAYSSPNSLLGVLWMILNFVLVWWTAISFSAQTINRSNQVRRLSWFMCVFTTSYFFIGGWFANNAFTSYSQGNHSFIESYSWSWLSIPAYWLIPVLWFVLSVRWRDASVFPYVMASLMTLVTFLSLGKMLWGYWGQLF